LRLTNAQGEEVGTLVLNIDGSFICELNDADAGPLLTLSTGEFGELLTIHGTGGTAFLSVLLTPLPSYTAHLPDGTSSTVEGRGWQRNKEQGTVITLLKLGWSYVSPAKPKYTAQTEVPSDDIRLVTKEGSPFAVLGLGDGGEPSIAFLRRNGGLIAVLRLTEEGMFGAGKPKQWPMLSLFDDGGNLLMTVECGPGAHPVLTIYEKSGSRSADWGIYALDPTVSKEIPVQHPFSGSKREGTIAWLSQKVAPAPPPITLIDERGSALWRYTSPAQ
jgi:hypothetical protein